jgi:transposase-like protein
MTEQETIVFLKEKITNVMQELSWINRCDYYTDCVKDVEQELWLFALETNIVDEEQLYEYGKKKFAGIINRFKVVPFSMVLSGRTDYEKLNVEEYLSAKAKPINIKNNIKPLNHNYKNKRIELLLSKGWSKKQIALYYNIPFTELFPNQEEETAEAPIVFASKYNHLLQTKITHKLKYSLPPQINNKNDYKIYGQLDYVDLHIKLRNEFSNLPELEAYFNDDFVALEYLENFRWSDKVVCPFCGKDKLYKFEKVFNTTKRTYKCVACKNKFNIKTKTILQNTKVPLRKWIILFYKGTPDCVINPSLQLSRELGVTQRTAWYLQYAFKKINRWHSYGVKNKYKRYNLS